MGRTQATMALPAAAFGLEDMAGSGVSSSMHPADPVRRHVASSCAAHPFDARVE